MPGPSLFGVILAAGQSRRMGRPKALLRIPPAGDTFLARAIDMLRRGGVPHLTVVGRREDELLRAELARIDESIPYLVNVAPEAGQLSSVLVGVAYAEEREAAGVMVLPVDMPLVRAETCTLLLDAFAQGNAPIVRPTHRGRHGHPVIFRASVFGDLRSADMSVGAKAVIRQHEPAVLNVVVSDPWVTRDIDRPDDYRAVFQADPS